MYNKTTWHRGDIITSALLNNIEGGVESVSTILDTAMTDGGIGYDDPEELLVTLTEETTIDPAIVELTADTEYTFRIVDTDHPDGVRVTGTSEFGPGGVIEWAGVIDDPDAAEAVYVYVIVYEENDVNIMRSYHSYYDDQHGWVDVDNYPVSVYQPGRPNKIAVRYIDVDSIIPPQLTVTLTTDGSTVTSDTSGLKIWKHIKDYGINAVTIVSTDNQVFTIVEIHSEDYFLGISCSSVQRNASTGDLIITYVTGRTDIDRGREIWNVYTKSLS